MFDVEQASRDLLNEAIQKEASDIHFVPGVNGYHVFYRLTGSLTDVKVLDALLADRLISHFKYHSGMDIGERRKPQSTAMVYPLREKTYSLRLSTLPAKPRESLTIRISPQHALQSLSHLPLLSYQSKVLSTAATLTQGLVLITGATGSGKTTTIYAMLEEILSTGKRSIVTVEDPIERTIGRAVQVETNERAGVTFDVALRAALRHDPDVIVVGEIRDAQTAQLAIRASLSGHLVISTLHSSDAYGAIVRLREFGLSKTDLLEACKLVISQQLLPILCEVCQEEENGECLTRHKRASVFESLGGIALAEGIAREVRPSYQRMKTHLRKAWALGYIGKQMLEEAPYES
ncbi:competence type IV pilus ATPase ComGA [Shouchella shacheensis]|uniref:competence type IV pilus ATPase ComGA n=1 Tax=Shouchella shacheensis TaxID=1649580 RepID=UPI00073FC2FF|nr:competence type IV pilus ATPase ComGA [Shouchella shacheensis]